MKKLFHLPALVFLLGVIAPLWTCAAQTNFFSDTFNRGSTIDSLTPVPPTTNSTSYGAISSKIWYPPPVLFAKDLQFGISNTSGGMDEIQAMFATNPVALSAVGTDYVQLTIVFTNTSGGLLSTGQGYLGIGLYNTEGATNYPVPGGLNNLEQNSEGTAYETGNCQLWEGYAAEVAYEGGNQGDLIMTRPQQTTSPSGNNAQDLVIKGSTSQSYSYPAGVEVGSTAPSDPSLVLTTGGTYTEVFTVSLIGVDSLAITNVLYSGPTTNGAVLAQYGGIASGTTNIAASFNGFAFGFYQKTLGTSNVLDVSSIIVSGQSTSVSNLPSINTQPSSVLVATNGACDFSVSASGFNLTYQWQRNGTNLINGGNISGATSPMLVISPATTVDQLSQANGYCVIVTGAGNLSTNSVTNSLALIPSTPLIWNDDNSDVWDVNNSINWQDTNGNPSVFNYGDPVTFNDVGFGGPVELNNSFLSAASLTMAAVNFPYSFSSASTGGFAGPGSLLYVGPAKFTIANANTYTGGTLISNVTAHLILQNLAGLGSGPITLAGGVLEFVPAGNASSGIPGNVSVANNSTILVDATNNSYSGVFLGDLSGTPGMTLTITNGTTPNGGPYRLRAFGNSTVYNANLDLANSAILFAPYSSANSQTYNGVISGPGALMEKGTITYLNAPNTYTGGTTPAQGAIGLGTSSVGSPGSLSSGPIGTGPLFLAPDSTTAVVGDGQIFASNSPVSIGNAIQYPSGTNNLTLTIGGSVSLTLAGPYTLQGNDGLTTDTITSRGIEVTNTALTTITGVISDGGSNYGFNVSGTGTGASVLALNNTETYTGPTTVTDATLLVNGQIGSGAVTVATNATLGGDGIITGPVSILSGGALEPGNQAIGMLTISNSLTCASGSTNIIAVSGPSTWDKVKANSVTFNGTLIASNIGGTLSAGDSFTIYTASSYSGNFSAIAGTPGPGLGWSFNQTSGVLSVVANVALNPTNITYSVSGGNIYLSWPANHLGWNLQVQTNSVTHGIGTNWVTVPNSSAVDITNFPVVPANGTVFYRLMYP